MTSFTRLSGLGLSLIIALSGCVTQEVTTVPPPVPEATISIPALREEARILYEKADLKGHPLELSSSPIVLRAHKQKNIPQDTTSQINYKMSVIRELLTMVQPLTYKFRFGLAKPVYGSAEVATKEGVSRMKENFREKMQLVNITLTLRNKISALLEYSRRQVRRVRIASYNNTTLNIDNDEDRKSLLAIAGLKPNEYKLVQELIPMLSRAENATTLLWHSAAQHRFDDLRSTWAAVLMACAPLPGCKGLDTLGKKIDEDSRRKIYISESDELDKPKKPTPQKAAPEVKEKKSEKDTPDTKDESDTTEQEQDEPDTTTTEMDENN